METLGGRNWIHGNGGSDRDILCGNDGNDELNSEYGIDRLRGGFGDRRGRRRKLRVVARLPLGRITAR